MVANFDKPNPYPTDWALTPVKGKAAYLQNWRDRPIPINQIRRYWTQKQCTGLGVVLGQLSNGLVAVDIDGESARGAAGELPPTVISSSGKPGRSTHYYRLPEQYWDAAKHVKIPTGDKEQLELRWTGQQVLPPSVHPETDRPYEWIASPETVAVADAPEWLIVKMCCQEEQQLSAPALPLQRVTGEGVVDLVQCLAKNHQDLIANGAGEGGRDNSGAALARDLIGTANYLTQMGVRFEGDPRQLLADYCSRCSPPLSSRDCDRIYNSAEKSNPQPSVPLDKIQDRVDWQQGKRKQRQPQQQRTGGEIVPTRAMVAAAGESVDAYQQLSNVNKTLATIEATCAELQSKQVELKLVLKDCDPFQREQVKGDLDLVKTQIQKHKSEVSSLVRQRTDLKAQIRKFELEEARRIKTELKDDRPSWWHDRDEIHERLAGRVRYNLLKQRPEVEHKGIWKPLTAASINYQLTQVTGFPGWKQKDADNGRIIRSMAMDEDMGLMYNPIEEYLRDVSERLDPDFELLDTLAYKMFGIEDKLQNDFLKTAIIAAVGRGLLPGCEWRNMLILVGEEWCGKSKFIRRLFGEGFYGSGQFDFKNKDAMIETKLFWGYEYEEVNIVLTGRGKIQEAVKAFLSRVSDSYRPVHGIEPIEVERICTFWGTSNHQNLLSEGTGDTRYLILQIPDGYQVSDAKWHWFDEIRDLLWATAYHAYFALGGIPRIDAIAQKEHNQAFHDSHPWQDLIAPWMESRAEPPTTQQVLTQVLQLEPNAQDKPDTMPTIRAIMQRLGYKSKQVRLAGQTARTSVWVPK